MRDTKVFNDGKGRQIIISTVVERRDTNKDKFLIDGNLVDNFLFDMGKCSKEKNQFDCEKKQIFGLNQKIDTTESSLDKFIYKFKNDDNLIIRHSIKLNNILEPTDSNNFNFYVPPKRCLNITQEMTCIIEGNIIESNFNEKKKIFTLEEDDVTTLSFGNLGISSYTHFGKDNPTINLCQNLEYKFNIESKSHPMVIENINQNKSFNEINIIFSNTGTYNYKCDYHPNMKGIINIVNCF